MDTEAWATFGQVVGAIVAGLTLIGLLWQGTVGLLRLYRATFGRMQVAYRKLGKLAPDVTHDYFSSVLGAPVFRRASYGHTEFVYVDRYFYVQAWVDDIDVVTFYTVTSRSKRFHPSIWNDAASWVLFKDQGRKLKLGKFTFSEIPEWSPSGITGHVGARRYSYAETYYFGNPGHYQTYVLGFTDAGVAYKFTNPLTAMPDYRVHLGTFLEAADDEAVESYVRQSHVEEFRRTARPNLFGVTSPHFNFEVHDEAGQIPIGPDADRVRLLAE